jgi:catechol 2,3-dioxygenase-like lactoylglutathione lyase family enzyme
MSIAGVITQLRTTNLDESIAFYVDKIGLELEFRYEDFYAGIRVGYQSFHLKFVDDPDPSLDFVAAGGHMHLYFPTSDVDATAQMLQERGVVMRSDVRETPWGNREFYASDDQGHVLCFAQGQEDE